MTQRGTRRVLKIVGAGLTLLMTPGFAQVEETLARWPYYREIELPRPDAGLVDIVLDAAILDQARTDCADLRLYNRAGKEVPYALRIRRDVHTSDAFEAREFNRGVRGRAAEVSLDLGADVAEHNEIEVDTRGQNFRRRVEVEGSPDGERWSTLVSRALIFRFSGANGSVDERRVKYPPSRYRYLRVRVYPDPQVDGTAPAIRRVTIRRTLRLEGETLTFPGIVEGREPTRENGRPASRYRLDLGGRIPLHGLQLTIADDSFSRPYRLDAVVEDQRYPRRLTSGRLVRDALGAGKSTVIEFDEHFARELELTVTDDRNPPLSLLAVQSRSAARQVVFDAGAPGAGPVRLYYGNPDARAPHYDFAGTLPRKLPTAPIRRPLGPERENPNYAPAPKPLTERSPWLIYLVLGLASLVLFVILRNLAGAARGERET